MKRTTKSVTAFVLTLLLIVASPVAAFAATSGTIDGESTVDNVTVNVILPTTLDFALDPLGLDTTGDSQIATQDLFFVNQTFAPVKISVDITAETSGGAVLVATTGGLSLDDTSVTDKKLYFGALGATGLTGASITTTTAGISYSAIFGSTTGPAASYATVSAVAETLAVVTPNTDGTTGSAVISFALAKAIESATTAGAIDSLAANNKGVAAFQFYSQLNTYADWKANDITVSGTYTLTPLRDTTYTGYDYIDGSLNQLVPPVVVPPAPTTFSVTVENDGHGTATADLSTATAGAVVTLSNTPASGYQFSSWSSTPGSLTISGGAFTMPSENVTVKANFTAVPVGFTSGSTTTTSINVATITSGSAFSIPFNFGSNTLSRINLPSATLVAADQYTVSGSSITFIASRATALKGISASTYYTITLSDNSTYVINWIK